MPGHHRRGHRQRVLDALVGGLAGIIIGSGLFTALYPKPRSGILTKEDCGDLTLPRLFKITDWLVVLPLAVLLVLLLNGLELAGL